ncbi:MAG: tripartite tricarboxylate transporter TctB family protein [Oceanospirillaceae bacterium]|nr:tripartite tricarboxylate transporter TctB family protein [Oceanospirillaceae bacterium]
MSAPLPRKVGELFFGFIVLAFSVFLFWQAYEISGFSELSSPGSVPMAAAALMVLAACINLLKDLARPTSIDTARSFFRVVLPPIVAIMIAIIFLFGIVLETLGFIISAFIFLLVSIQFLHKKGFIRSFLLSLLALSVIYIIFRLVFSVILPEGLIPERDIMAWIGSQFSSGA